jgi:hypothetical protein
MILDKSFSSMKENDCSGFLVLNTGLSPGYLQHKSAASVITSMQYEGCLGVHAPLVGSGCIALYTATYALIRWANQEVVFM